jgi:hypothetical protein
VLRVSDRSPIKFALSYTTSIVFSIPVTGIKTITAILLILRKSVINRMERVHKKSNESRPDVHQQEGRDLNNVRNDENSSINQEIQQTSGIQSYVLAECNQTSQQASEAERNQFYEEQRIMENMKSSILSCNIAVAEEMRKLIVSTEEQKKQIRDFLVMQESREMNVAEAKHRNEALDLDLQISKKNIH